MGIPIKLPGLSEYIDEIPESSTILVEGNIDPIKTIFVQHLAGFAHGTVQEINYICSRAKEEVIEQMKCYSETTDFPIIEERSSRHWKDFIKEKSLLIIDSFSYLILDDSLIEVRNIIEELDSLCKQHGAIVILTVEEGMLDEKIRITVGHIADGIIRFLSRDTAKGVARFMRIPKWMNQKSFDDNIFYTFDNKKIKVDLRSRVT